MECGMRNAECGIVESLRSVFLIVLQTAALKNGNNFATSDLIIYYENSSFYFANMG